MPLDGERLSAAIVDAFREYPWIASERVVADYGPEMLRAIANVVEFAGSHTDIWIKNADLAVSSREVEKLVADAFPQLTPAAVKAIVDAAAYQWK